MRPGIHPPRLTLPFASLAGVSSPERDLPLARVPRAPAQQDDVPVSREGCGSCCMVMEMMVFWGGGGLLR